MAALLALLHPAAAQQAVALDPGETAVIGAVTVTNGSGQPANVSVLDGVLDVAVPVGFAVIVQGADCMPVVPAPNFARCSVAPGAIVTLTIANSLPPPAAPQPAPPPAPPQLPPAFPPPPQALTHAGTGLVAERPAGPWTVGGLAGAIAVLASVGALLRRRAQRIKR